MYFSDSVWHISASGGSGPVLCWGWWDALLSLSKRLSGHQTCISLILWSIFLIILLCAFLWFCSADLCWGWWDALLSLSERLSGARSSSPASPSCGPVGVRNTRNTFRTCCTSFLHLLCVNTSRQLAISLFLQNVIFYQVLPRAFYVYNKDLPGTHFPHIIPFLLVDTPCLNRFFAALNPHLPAFGFKPQTSKLRHPENDVY